MAPTVGPYQVLIVEDADRVTERGADALLKAIEEPAARTVWLLCAPTAADVVVTIRSRCRLLSLVTPSAEAVAGLLVRRDAVAPDRAAFFARLAQGHIGRARGLARDPAAMARRQSVLTLPGRLTGLGEALRAADELVKTSQELAEAATAELNARERAALDQTLNTTGRGPKLRQTSAVKDLTEQQAMRTKRWQRDDLDAALTELTGYYRDVLVHQLQARVELLNSDQAAAIAQTAAASTPVVTSRRLDAIVDCREQLARNVAPLLAFEALFVALL
jgi:DNA polymerase-3 subunit delta'